MCIIGVNVQMSLESRCLSPVTEELKFTIPMTQVILIVVTQVTSVTLIVLVTLVTLDWTWTMDIRVNLVILVTWVSPR